MNILKPLKKYYLTDDDTDQQRLNVEDDNIENSHSTFRRKASELHKSVQQQNISVMSDEQQIISSRRNSEDKSEETDIKEEEVEVIDLSDSEIEDMEIDPPQQESTSQLELNLIPKPSPNVSTSRQTTPSPSTLPHFLHSNTFMKTLEWKPACHLSFTLITVPTDSETMCGLERLSDNKIIHFTWI